MQFQKFFCSNFWVFFIDMLLVDVPWWDTCYFPDASKQWNIYKIVLEQLDILATTMKLRT